MSLLKPAAPENPVKRPENLGEAREIIEKSFCYQSWDESERKRYFGLIGVDGTADERDVRRIIEDMEKTGMILFERESSQ